MHPHRFDPLSVIIGGLVVTAGSVVVTFGTEHIDDRAVLGAAAAAAIIGVFLLPWRRRPGSEPDD